MSAEPVSAGDQTQPTDEILSVLNALSNSNNSVKSEPHQDALPPPPTSEYDVLTAQLKEKPHNPEGWRRLIDWVENSGDVDKLRSAFEALLQTYPNTSSAQIRYIGHFLNDENTFHEAEELFKKFLKFSPSVDLWKFYLTYVRRVNTTPATRDGVRKSYEFALGRVGQDKDSGEIWKDYIQFLKSGEATTTWEEQQKMDVLRKVYHRAVQIPLDNVEALWQELEAFETSLNRITAKKFMSDLSPAHMQARTTLRQLINATKDLYPPTPPSVVPGRPELVLPSIPTFTAKERALMGTWKQYLKWEEGNPLEIEERDRSVLISRIQGVYRKVVVRMRFYPEIWFMAYTWTNSVGKHDEAMSILRSGMEANPSSFLLTFAYAEAQELKKEYADVHATFDKFLTCLQADLEVIETRTKAEDAAAGTPPGLSAGNTNGTDLNGNGPGTNSQNSSFNSQTSEEGKPKTTELQERRAEYGLAYIVYMRFARRAEGVKASRAIFARARKDRWAPWEVYEASALMEYHSSDDKAVASRIFERGLELFGDEVDFVVRYLGFLISVNDIQNARALFERVIPTFSADDARPIWERWARYDYQYGDLDAAQKLEARISAVFPKEPPIKRFAQRHTYLNIDAIALRDLGAAMARKAGPQGGAQALGRTETFSTLQSNLNAPMKRPSSPDHYGRGGGAGAGGLGSPQRGEYSQGHKRARGASPIAPRGERDRDGGRWGDGRRRFSPAPAPPGWEGRGDVRESREAREAREARETREREQRERERAIPPPRVQERERLERERAERERLERIDREREERERERDRERERERQRQVHIPQVISWFIGELPRPTSFDGPVFRTEDLMNLFRNAVIPSTSKVKSEPGPPPHIPSRGRPAPDYGAYQGPGGGGRRRY